MKIGTEIYGMRAMSRQLRPLTLTTGTGNNTVRARDGPLTDPTRVYLRWQGQQNWEDVGGFSRRAGEVSSKESALTVYVSNHERGVGRGLQAYARSRKRVQGRVDGA